MQIVIYCSVTNYHRHSGLKQHIYIISVSGGQETRYSLAGSSASQFLIKFHKVFTKGWVSSESSTRERITPKFMWLFLEQLLMRERKRDRERDRESASKMEVTILCHMVTEIISHYLCHILLVRSNSEVLPVLKGRGLFKALATKRQRSFGPPNNLPAVAFVCGRATSHQEALRVYCGFWWAKILAAILSISVQYSIDTQISQSTY